MTAATPIEVDYDRIREAGDHIVPEPFRRNADGNYPAGTDWIGYGYTSPGDRLEDARGQRFRVMAHGPMQGTMVLRDRYRRMFYFDTGARMIVHHA